MLDLFDLLKAAQEHKEWVPRGKKRTAVKKAIHKNRRTFAARALLVKPRREYDLFAYNLEKNKRI
jgi:hypothetical protein